jgi:SAM-dependent methyltransferase
MAEWFEDESFWRSFYPVMFSDERFQRAEDQVEKVLKLTDFRGRDVLDLCCGPGRHSILLARRGFRVTGVDRTRFLLDKARARAEQEGVQVEWVEQDMRDFVRPRAFDLVLNMWTSFGYFDDKSEDLRVLRNIYDSLRNESVFMIDVIGKEYLARVLQPTTSQPGADGSLLVERREIFDDWSRIRNEWILIKDGQARTFKFHNTVYSAQELKDRLLHIGFRQVTVYGDLDGNEYGANALRLIAVARK